MLKIFNLEKNVEEETEEIKKNLEQFKVKLESLKQKVAGQSLLQNKFGTAVADGAKFIETLSDILKVFRQQKTDNEKGKTELGNAANKLVASN